MVVVIVAAVFLLPKIIYFFMPFILGFIISRMASPIVTWLNKKIKVKRKALSATVMVLVVGLLILACYGISVVLYRQLVGFIDQLPQMWDDTKEDISGIGVWYQSIADKLPKDIRTTIMNVGDGIMEAVSGWVSKISSPTISAVGNFAMTIPGFLVGLVMTILSAYFFLDEKDYVTSLAHKLIPRSFQEKWEILKQSFITAVGGYFKAQIRIELWMYLILVIGLAILDTRYTLLVALGIAILDFLPVFGTGTVLVPWAVIKLVAGDYKKAVILMVIWAGGQLLRQLIQPKIVSNSIGLQPIPTLFLLFIGWKVKGVIGMILAIPIGLILYNLHEAGAFDRLYETVTILVNDLNAFCKYSKEDREFFKRYGTLKEAELELPEELIEKEKSEEKKSEDNSPA